MNIQKHVEHLTKISFKELNLNNLRGVTAQWKNEENTLALSMYFDGEPTEEEKDDVSAICAEIIASFSDALMEENYMRWDYPKPLPTQFLAYQKS